MSNTTEALDDDHSSGSANMANDDSSIDTSKAGSEHQKNDKGSTEGRFTNNIWSNTWIFIAILAVLLAGLGVAIFLCTSNLEDDEFEAVAEGLAYEITQASQARAQSMFGVISSLSATLSGIADSTNESTWPFETFENFEEIVAPSTETAHVRFVGLAPIVKNEEKATWEQYASAQQGWIEDSFEALGLSVAPLPIPPAIYDVTDGHATEATQGPFMPLWQLSPPPRNTGAVNYNFVSNRVVQEASSVAIANEEALISQITDLDISIDGVNSMHQSILVYPIYDNESAGNSPTIVATLLASISWDDFFKNLARNGNQGMICVLENTCGDVMSYAINGKDAEFLGMGDEHDSDFNDYEVSVKLTPFISMSPESEPGYCEYRLHAYPSRSLEEDHSSKIPAALTGVIVCIFAIFGICFVVFNYKVQRRAQQANDQAAKTDAIVQSFVPEEIHKRLFNEAKKGSGNESERKTKASEAGQKYRLKNFLDEEGVDNDESISEDKGAIKESKPIADLFPNTTVLFADIAGFTAWSSVREPSQVFTLLETVFKAFDKTAKKRKVFKVETVGDCYVAVTGLPDPVKEHAAVMCKFARECLTQFNATVRKLEVLLGPDTGDLAIRVGIHSGPVTAGVLRGDKSRFQLFGDTMNTAARIESTGLRDKIHLSHESAELLHAAGKSNWIQKRTDTVMAKGKGEMQTYWLLTDEDLASGVRSADGGNTAAPLPIVKANAARLATGVNMANPEESLPPRIKRLVDWNVDVLKRLLKQVIAKRQVLGKENLDPNHPLMMKEEVNIGCDTYVLDEVKEIIRLPGYVHAKEMKDLSKIELPEEVSQQLRLYVASIAAMHRDNAFHNFEHASHVMMSVSKLLSRIVAPAEVARDGDGEAAHALNLHDHTYGITSDPLTQFSVVLAALIHDVDHAGVSNSQLIKEGAKIATVFKEKSVAEQNSIVLAWDRLMESRFTALRAHIYGDQNELKRFRQLMVNTVLATDIFDKELQELRKTRWDNAFRDIDAKNDSTPEDDVNRRATIVIEHLIQASDVAHTMQHWHIYQKWNERLFAEMTAAYQSGRQGWDPSTAWYKGELGFFDNYIIPLAKKLKECGVFGVSSDEYLNYALENRREWANKGEAVVERYIKKYNMNQDVQDEVGKSERAHHNVKK